jgi:hypothetical protein
MGLYRYNGIDPFFVPLLEWYNLLKDILLIIILIYTILSAVLLNICKVVYPMTRKKGMIFHYDIGLHRSYSIFDLSFYDQDEISNQKEFYLKNISKVLVRLKS